MLARSGAALKSLVRKGLVRLGYTIVRMPVDAAGRPPDEAVSRRMGLEGVLEQLRRLGVEPTTIVDVGAAYGDFTRVCASLFPEARLLMLEPLIEYKPALDAVVAEYPRAALRMAAAARAPGVRTINVHPDFVGSSFMLETEEQTDVNGVPREVSVTTLDEEIRKLGLPARMLLKVDVQGAELEVLGGAGATLRACDVVILEATLFNTFAGGPLLDEVVAFMAARGFRVYDITGHLYRPLDGALMQVDLVFVPEPSPLRKHHAYATPEQRAEQTKRFAARLGTA